MPPTSKKFASTPNASTGSFRTADQVLAIVICNGVSGGTASVASAERTSSAGKSRAETFPFGVSGISSSESAAALTAAVWAHWVVTPGRTSALDVVDAGVDVVSHAFMLMHDASPAERVTFERVLTAAGGDELLDAINQLTEVINQQELLKEKLDELVDEQLDDLFDE